MEHYLMVLLFLLITQQIKGQVRDEDNQKSVDGKGNIYTHPDRRLLPPTSCKYLGKSCKQGNILCTVSGNRYVRNNLEQICSDGDLATIKDTPSKIISDCHRLLQYNASASDGYYWIYPNLTPSSKVLTYCRFEILPTTTNLYGWTRMFEIIDKNQGGNGVVQFRNMIGVGYSTIYLRYRTKNEWSTNKYDPLQTYHDYTGDSTIGYTSGEVIQSFDDYPVAGMVHHPYGSGYVPCLIVNIYDLTNDINSKLVNLSNVDPDNDPANNLYNFDFELYGSYREFPWTSQTYDANNQMTILGNIYIYIHQYSL